MKDGGAPLDSLSPLSDPKSTSRVCFPYYWFRLSYASSFLVPFPRLCLLRISILVNAIIHRYYMPIIT